MRTSCLLLSQTPQRFAKLKNNAILFTPLCCCFESIVIFALKLLFMLACDEFNLALSNKY